MGIARTLILLSVLSLILVIAGALLGGMTGVVIALAVAAGMNIFSWWNSDRIVLKVQGAKLIDDSMQAPVLKRFVDDVCQLAERAGLPRPQVYLMDTPQPNAFATGRSPDRAAIAATTGLLSSLTREEVAGVVAHELAHIKHRDTLTMTVTATIAGAISTLGLMQMFAGRSSERSPLAGPIVMLLAPLAASLVQMSISRGREYEADREGAEICGNPLWLASALEKIHRGTKAIVHQRAQRTPAMAHLYIANPLLGRQGDNWFSTHPAMENRIAALHRMAAEQSAARIEKERGTSAARGPWG
jgi:heat shock protein HtpX